MTQLNTVPFLTVFDVADRLRVHPETVREWVRHGKLGAVYAGRQWLEVQRPVGHVSGLGQKAAFGIPAAEQTSGWRQ